MNIFAYGILGIPEIMKKLTGREHTSERGSLRGYVRLMVRDQVYPALLPFPDTQTDGMIYFDVSEESLKRIDEFEGGLYERVEVNIETEDGEWVEAETYVIKLKRRKDLTAEPWDEYKFRKRHMQDFLRARSLA